MNHLLSKGLKHRKATSYCLTNCQVTQSPGILNNKLLSHFTKGKFTNSSTEKTDKIQFKLKQNTNYRMKPIQTMANTKRSKPKKINQLRRSSSFDKYFLFKITNNNDEKKSNNTPDNINQVNAASSLVPQINLKDYIKKYYVNNTQRSPKQLTINSPVSQKQIELKTSQPIAKSTNKQRNTSNSIEDNTPKTYVSFGKINSVLMKNKNTMIIKSEVDFSHQISKKKKEIKIQSNKLTERLPNRKQIAPLMTMPSQSNKIKHFKDKTTKIKKLPLSTRRPPESSKDETIEEIQLNENIAREFLCEGNYDTNEIDEDVDTKGSVHMLSQAKSKLEIDIPNTKRPELIFHNSHMETTANYSLNQKESPNISLKYHDIIQNNIKYCKQSKYATNSNKLTYTTKSQVDSERSNTPKFVQIYHYSKLNNENSKSNSNMIKESKPKKHETLTNKKNSNNVLYKNKRCIQLPNKTQKKDTNESTATENENTIEINTECRLEGDEKNDREIGNNIPVLSIKFLTKPERSSLDPGINCLEPVSSYLEPKLSSLKPELSSLELCVNIEVFSLVFLSYLDLKSLTRVSLCNHSLRTRLKKIQYERIHKIVMDNDKTEVRAKIKKTVWVYSKLYNELNFLEKTYWDCVLRRSSDDEDIQKDLTRTFPEDESFKYRNKNYSKLYNLLTAYANFNNRIGYAQGLNFLVANSIYAFDKPEEVFIFVDGLINKFQLEQLYGVTNHLKDKIEEIGKLLRKSVPKVMRYLDETNLGHEFFTASWLLTLFSNSMSRTNLFHIWDFMIVFGKNFFNYFTVAIMLRYSEMIVTYDQGSLSQLMKGLLKSDIFESDFLLIIDKTFELIRLNCL